MDYYNGKPLKLDWEKNPGGLLVANCFPYDVAHGKFRFFEALLNVFDPEEILITEKEDDSVLDKLYFKKEDSRIIECELAQILQNAITFTDETGTYWKIDGNDNRYRSAFLNGLNF